MNGASGQGSGREGKGRRGLWESLRLRRPSVLQQPHPPLFAAACGAVWASSLIGAAWAAPPASLPAPPEAVGSASAICWKSAATLCPAFALVSRYNILPSDAAFSASSVGTSRRSDKSVLLPTSATTASSPRSLRTSSTHFDVAAKDARLVMS